MQTHISLLLWASTTIPLSLSAPYWTAASGNTSTVNSPDCHDADDIHKKVFTFNVGTHTRCMTVTTPADVHSSMPILFWFHGATSSSRNGGCSTLSDLAEELGFVLVCAEALQNIFGDGGQWLWPEVTNEKTGTQCDSEDLLYVSIALKTLRAESNIYDTSRLFFAGCSMGSQFSLYTSICLKQQSPGNVSAFATHSSGLKVKGDGLQFPRDIYNRQYQWGECPDCQYIPAVPHAFHDELGLKACIFDNTGDYPEFYWSSAHLAYYWEKNNMPAEVHMDDAGGHCVIPSFMEIVRCLDDGTGRLLQANGRKNVSNLTDVVKKSKAARNFALVMGRRRGLDAPNATSGRTRLLRGTGRGY